MLPTTAAFDIAARATHRRGGGGKDGSAKLMTKAGEREGRKERPESLTRKGRRERGRGERAPIDRPANRPTADRARIRCATLTTDILRLLVRLRDKLTPSQYQQRCRDGERRMLSDGKHDCCGRSVLQTVTATAAAEAKAATQKRLERKERREEGSGRGDAHSAGQVWVHGTEGQGFRIILLRFEFCRNMSAPQYH